MFNENILNFYLHIGTEKTGSSFIQSLIYYNRQILLSHNIFAPKDKFEDIQIPKGQVSGGNGFEFYNLLKDKKLKRAYNYLYLQKKKAKSIDCKAILISNENLFRVLAENFDFLMSSFEKLGFKLKLCLFLRDPLDHIISMYKHRNKHGKHQNFKQWLYHDYSTIKDLEIFRNKLKHSHLNYDKMVFLYEKPISLKILFFENFIGIKTHNFIKINKSVNKSLTLSEIFFLKTLYKPNFNLRYKLSLSLQNLEQNSKANDTSVLLQQHNKIIWEYLIKHRSLIKNVYEYFDCQIDLNNQYKIKNDIPKGLVSADKIYYTFTDKQLSTIFKTLKDEVRFVNILSIKSTSINIILSKIKRGLF